MWVFNAVVGILMVVMYCKAKAKGQTLWMVAFAIFTVLNFTFAYLTYFN